MAQTRNKSSLSWQAVTRLQDYYTTSYAKVNRKVPLYLILWILLNGIFVLWIFVPQALLKKPLKVFELLGFAVAKIRSKNYNIYK